MAETVRLTGPKQRSYAKELIDKAQDSDVMRLGKETRTEEQNRKLWPMIEDLRRQVPKFAMFTKDDMKLRFLNALGTELRFLPTLEGEGVFPVGLRSSTLTKQQFAGLVELIYAEGAKHGVRWSEPLDERWAA